MKSSWSTLGICAGLLLCASPLRADVVNRIVASVDGEPITLYELDEYAVKQHKLLPNVQVPSQNDLLQALITEKLLKREIQTRGIRVRDPDIDRYIDHIKEQNKVDDAQLKQALAQQGIDYAKYRDQIRGEIEKVQLMNREIRGKVNISPEDVHRYYEAHKKEYYAKAGQVKARQITVRLEPGAPEEIVNGVLARITDIRARAVKGEDFPKLAKQYSEDPMAADGGDMGEVEPTKLLPELESALADMKDGDISQPIRSKSGFHLLKLDKRIPIGYQPEEELAAEIKEKLYNDTLEERYKRWLLEDIQKSHFVENKL